MLVYATIYSPFFWGDWGAIQGGRSSDEGMRERLHYTEVYNVSVGLYM